MTWLTKIVAAIKGFLGLVSDAQDVIDDVQEKAGILAAKADTAVDEFQEKVDAAVDAALEEVKAEVAEVAEEVIEATKES